MQAQPDNDFMAGFNDDADPAAAGAAGAGGDANNPNAGAGDAAAGGGGDASNGQGAAGAAQGGAAAGSAGAADQGTAGAASAGDSFAAGLAGEEQPGGENSGAQGVDSAQNGEQGRVESQELDLSSLPEPIRQRLEEAERLRQQVEQLDGSLAASRRDFQALHNRVAPLQQQLATLQQGAQPAQQQQPAAGSGDVAAGETLADADKAIADAEAYFESPAFKRYAEQWPDEAAVTRESQMGTLKAIRTMRQQLEKQVGDVSRTVQQDVVPHLQQVRQNEAVTARERELSDLATAHPDWQEINVSPEFTAWFEKQKPLLNFKDADHMVERLNDGGYVSSLLTSYKEATGYGKGGDPTPTAEQLQQQQEQQRQQQEAAARQQQSNGASARLAMSGGPGKTGVAVVTRPNASGVTPGDDFLAGFTST